MHAPKEALEKRNGLSLVLGRIRWTTMSSAVPVVMCPGCKVEMKVLSSQPIQSGSQMDEVTYRCPQCRTETQRRYRPTQRLKSGPDATP